MYTRGDLSCVYSHRRHSCPGHYRRCCRRSTCAIPQRARVLRSKPCVARPHQAESEAEQSLMHVAARGLAGCPHLTLASPLAHRARLPRPVHAQRRCRVATACRSACCEGPPAAAQPSTAAVSASAPHLAAWAACAMCCGPPRGSQRSSLEAVNAGAACKGDLIGTRSPHLERAPRL